MQYFLRLEMNGKEKHADFKSSLEPRRHFHCTAPLAPPWSPGPGSQEDLLTENRQGVYQSYFPAFIFNIALTCYLSDPCMVWGYSLVPPLKFTQGAKASLASRQSQPKDVDKDAPRPTRKLNRHKLTHSNNPFLTMASKYLSSRLKVSRGRARTPKKKLFSSCYKS